MAASISRLTTTQGGTTNVGFSVDIDVEEVRRMLAKASYPEMQKRTKAGLREAGKIGKNALVSEAPSNSTRLRRKGSVKLHAPKKPQDRPGIWIHYDKDIAYFKHFVMGGTKKHGTREKEGGHRNRGNFLIFYPNWNPYMKTARPAGARQIRVAEVKGVQPNPFADRAFAKAERPMTNAFWAKLREGLD